MTFFENLIGALQVGSTLLASPLLRGWYNRWGAMPAEIQQQLPGDELVPKPMLGYTRAITIHASVEHVWSWLVQIGQGRGGLYSYDGLENLAGCDIHSAESILPELQNPQVGELVRLGPKGYPCFAIAAIDPGRALVLISADPKSEQPAIYQSQAPKTYSIATWQFILQSQNESTTRLLVRQRLAYSPDLAWVWRLTEPVGFVMERKMMLGIRQRAERSQSVKDDAWRVKSVSFPKKIMFILGRVLVLLLSLLLCLPVILLPLSTAVPAWIWISLALLDVALVILQFRLTPVWRAITVSLAGAILVSLLAVVFSQTFAATPPILDTNGKPLPGSIATLEKVTLNGTEQWITIRSQDATQPVLLHLGMGGPGGGGFATRSLFEPLEKYFVVVSWDEPGTGKSYNALPISTLTPQRFVEDAHALTMYLRERFHQDKIYVYGVSWTSILGIWLVQQYPQLYYAYLGNGQMVNTTENDIMGYELALQFSRERGDTKTVNSLLRNGPPPYFGEEMLGKYVLYLDILNDYMHSPRYTLIVPIIPFLAPEYGLVDKINHTRGLMESFEVVYPQLSDLDFTTQAARLEVPVYIFAGRDDVNAMSSLVEGYYELLEAPHKELVWLNGGHGLGSENLDQFVDVMVNTVLAQTQPSP